MTYRELGRPLDSSGLKLLQREAHRAGVSHSEVFAQVDAEGEAINADANPCSTFKPYNWIFVFTLLAFLIWIAHFWYSRQFGLYEDDWNRIPKIIGIGWKDLWILIRANATLGQSQGRPLHPTLILLFSFLGFKAGGLQGIYKIAFAIALVNAILFYWLLNRIFHNERFALLGSLAFVLFPADTTQAFLTHALGVQPSITLVLLAFHCYLSDWKKCSYFLILLTLFTYETSFPVFFAAPFLQRPRKSGIVKHGLVLMAMLTSVFVLRALTADSRVSHLGFQEVLLSCTNPITGPIVNVALYFYRPFEGLFSITGYEPIALLIVCIAIAWILSKDLWPEMRTTRLAAPQALARIQPALIGLIMLVAAYPLTVTTVGFAVAGRGTRVHTAAIFGSSILCAYGCWMIFSHLTTKVQERLAAVGVATFFTLLLAFGLRVQRDYVLSWQEQRGFWTDVLRLCPDLSDGDVILVEPTGLRDTRQLLFLRKQLTGAPDTRQIKSLEDLFDILPQIYKFPTDWVRPPRVYRLPLDWKKEIFAGDDQLRTVTIEAGDTAAPSPTLLVPPSKVIFLETKNGHLTRRADIQSPQGGQMQLKTSTDFSRPFEAGSIYPSLIILAGEKPIEYLVR